MDLLPTPPGSGRVGAVDAFRGLVMFLMLAELLALPRVARQFPDSDAWRAVGFHTSHVAWAGCSLHDLIQPSFSFLVGVAVPWSVAGRRARGQSFAAMFGHAVLRGLVLVALGIFLRSTGETQTRTNFTFEDTLTQIGLGYPLLFLLGFARRPVQAAALAAVLVGYWALFVLYPLPGPGFDYAAVGVPADWPHHFSGLAAHFNKNSNAAWAFDTWFLNLFPRGKPFTHNAGGYATLSFIPTLGTMILGLVAGGWLREPWPARAKVLRLAAAGVAGLAAGWLLHVTGVCPVVKRIWTPAWTLFSGGWCFLFLAAFYGLMEVLGVKRWAFPLVVIGMNSLAIYCLSHLIDRFILRSLRTHLGQDVFRVLGPVYEPVVAGAAVLLVFWLILFWMYRRRLFLRV